MLAVYICVGFCLLLSNLTTAKEIPLPIFMKGTPISVRTKFTEIISRPDLLPSQRRQLVDQLMAIQPPKVQQAYQKFNNLVAEHKKKFKISLEAELTKARQEYIRVHGHQ